MGETDNRTRGILSRLFNLATTAYGVITFLGFVVLIFIIWSLSRSNFLDSLTNTETARGLITFLVVFTTVSIALILTLYTLISSSSDQHINDCFGYGKEVLTALIGILGTILGFYYGSSTQEALEESARSGLIIPQALQVYSAFAPSNIPKKGGIMQIHSFANDGESPYTYSISFRSPNTVNTIANRKASDGQLKEEIKIYEIVKNNTEFTIRIEVKDSNGKSAIYDDKTRKFVVKTP